MFSEIQPITVLQLNQRLSDAIAMAPGVRDVWVTAETSDVRAAAGGHCYLELVEKGSDGSNVSRIRANIWASTFRMLRDKFRSGAGIDFASGLKVLVRLTASYHPTYGMSATINDIDPSYTAGDAVRRRQEILDRLNREGILDLNRRISWSIVPNRIAVISAHGAAGYGDFITHLFSNPACLRFAVELFGAVMQGERTVPTVLEALEAIRQRADDFDAVVIIRGGGATTDLAAFDHYDLAAKIARFPLPVIVGIGHERDVTVLDFVANVRVKTPTAAAEHLIDRVGRVYDSLSRAAEKIFLAVTERIASNRELLAHAAASLPGTVKQTVLRRVNQLERNSMTLVTAGNAIISRRSQWLSLCANNIDTAALRAIERNRDRLNRDRQLLQVLSPDSVLARGFSLTLLPDGSVLTDASMATPGVTLTTRLSDGTVQSRVTDPAN